MRLTYENKVATRESTLPRKNSITAEDLNEIKESVNTLYDSTVDSGLTVELINDLTATFYAPNAMKITEVTSISNESASVIVLVNDASYTFGNQINQFDKITITSDLPVIINFATE